MNNADDADAVSVILPVYNGGRFLRAAIGSVLEQTHPRFELIVVDGGSTDETRAVAESFGGRLRYFHKVRGNVSIEKNLGIAQARHSIVAFMSADDLWHAEKLAWQVRLLTENPEMSACVCRLKYFLDDRCVWPGNFPERLREGEHTGYICEALVCRREVFSRVGLFDETYATAEDVDWYARARELGVAVGEVPEVLLHKRVHDRNISLTHPGIRRDLMRALSRSVRRKNAGAGA